MLITNDVDEGISPGRPDHPAQRRAGATLGPSDHVDIERPRDRKELNHDPRFKDMRGQVIDYLLGRRQARGRKASASRRPSAALGNPWESGMKKVSRRSTNSQRSSPRRTVAQIIVEDFNLEIAQGEFVSLIGHSGCGKSTVCRWSRG